MDNRRQQPSDVRGFPADFSPDATILFTFLPRS